MYGEEYLMKKCKAISGDVLELGLGMNKEDRLLLTDKVQMIYHCAATIRFDEPLKHAVMLNVRGTKLMLQLGRECKQLEVIKLLVINICIYLYIIF